MIHEKLDAGESGVEQYAALMEQRDITSVVLFLIYVAMISLIAERTGVSVTTWSPEFHEVYWRLHEAAATASGVTNVKHARKELAAENLSFAVVKERWPGAEHLTFAQVLKIRNKYHGELDALRTELAAIATRVDVNQPRQEIQFQIEELIATDVRPILLSVDAALRNARLDAMKRGKKPAMTLAASAAAVPVTIYFGAPVAVAGTFAALGLKTLFDIANVLVDMFIDQKRVLNDTPFSMLIRPRSLTKRKKKRTAFRT